MELTNWVTEGSCYIYIYMLDCVRLAQATFFSQTISSKPSNLSCPIIMTSQFFYKKITLSTTAGCMIFRDQI